MYIEQQSNAEKTLQSIYSEIFNIFSECICFESAKGPILHALDKIRSLTPSSEALPFLRAETIDAILKRGFCLCGNPIEKGSTEEATLLKLKDALPPHSISNSLGSFVRYYRDIYCETTNDNLPNKIVDYALKASDCDDQIAKAQDQISKISSNLADTSVSGQDSRISAAQHAITLKANKIEELLEEKGKKELQKEQKVSAIDSLKRELAQDSKNEPQKAFFRRCIAYTDEVARRLDALYKTYEESIVDQLNTKVKSTFQVLGLTDAVPSISKDYSFNCSDPSGMSVRLSESLSFIAALSTITALIRLGKELVEQDKILSSTVVDSVPLVMDAPLSSFDTTRIQAFGKLIPEMVDQLIIFIKDTEGNIVKPIMSDYIGCNYEIIPDAEYPNKSHFIIK